MTRAELREHIALTLYLKAGPSDRKGSACEAVRAADLLVDALYPVAVLIPDAPNTFVAPEPPVTYGAICTKGPALCVLDEGHAGECEEPKPYAPRPPPEGHTTWLCDGKHPAAEPCNENDIPF